VGDSTGNHFGGLDLRASRSKEGSFLLFLQSKSDLTVAALEAEWNKNKANMDALFSPTTPPLERFDRYFDYVHDRLAELQQECGSILGFPLLSIGSEVSTQDQGVRATVERIWDRKISISSPRFGTRNAQRLIVAPEPKRRRGRSCLLSRHPRPGANSKPTSNCSAILRRSRGDVLGVKHAPATSS